MHRLFIFILFIPLLYAHKSAITITHCDTYKKNNTYVLVKLKSNFEYIIKTNKIDICKKILKKTIGGYPVYLCSDYKYKAKRNCNAIQYQEFILPYYWYKVETK